MTLSDFNDIRPYNSEEIPQIIDELTTDEAFRESMRKTFTVPVDAMLAKGRQCGSLLEIQKTFVYPFIKGILDQKSDGIDYPTASWNLHQGLHTFLRADAPAQDFPCLSCVPARQTAPLSSS